MLRDVPLPRLTQILTLGLVLALGLTMMVGLASAQEGPRTHTVKEDETLADIAAMYGVTEEALLAANASAADGIEVGETLTIPESEAVPAGEATEAAPLATMPPASTGSETTYVVQPGDTVATIAESLGVDPVALIAANFGPDDNPGLIFPGDVLAIPGGAPQEGIGGGGGADQTYVVQTRDMLSEIALEFNVAVESIAYANGLEAPYVIMPGQVLIIPGNAPPFGVVPPAPGQPGYIGPAAVSSTGLQEGQGGGGGLGTEQSYTVQPGDMLDSIAQSLNVAVLSIAYANDLEAPYIIMPGQVLVIPADASPYGVVPPMPDQSAVSSTGLQEGQGGGGALGESGMYVVQEGDSVLSVTFALNVSLVDFLQANPQLLNQIVLEPGSELVIP